MRDEFAGQKLETWFIAVGDDPDEVAKFVADLRVRMPVWLDEDGAAIRLLLPPERRDDAQLPVAMNVLLDGAGKLLLRRVRGESESDAEMRAFVTVLRGMSGK
jgi:hypothetical protein